MKKRQSDQQGLENQGLNQPGQDNSEVQPQERQEDQLVGPLGDQPSGQNQQGQQPGGSSGQQGGQQPGRPKQPNRKQEG